MTIITINNSDFKKEYERKIGRGDIKEEILIQIDQHKHVLSKSEERKQQAQKNFHMQ